MVIRRFDVFLVPLDPARGSEMQKTRPCVVVTPHEVNRYLHTVLVAPLTSITRKYPFRPNCHFSGRQGQIALDQIRVVDHSRLLKHLGRIDGPAQKAIAETLIEMFDYDAHD